VSVRTFRYKAVFLALVLVATALAALASWYAAMEAGRRRAVVALDGSLQILSRSVESEIERFRYLPAVLSHDKRIRSALVSGKPEDIVAANDYLLAVRNDSRVDSLYIMKTDGLTIAASNFAEPTSFVGENYRFRPYFQDALRTGTGRYYAVGVTTGLPGYFLASAIRDGPSIIGVAVAKVDMRAVEQAWQEAGTLAAISDNDGVIFLTGRRQWKYRPLHPLDGIALQRVAETRKYDGVALETRSPILGQSEPEDDGTARADLIHRHLFRSIRIEPDGWQLWTAASMAPIRANANLVASLVALACLLLSGTVLYLRQRRQLLRAKLDANARLEQRVAERTAELNREIEERKRAEAELRDTHATLVQTAKLAALGRMSAAIVHEVSQPLAAMENTLASTALLAERGEAGRVIEKVGAARELVRRIRRTVKHLKSFARNEPGQRETVKVGKSVAAAVELALHRANASRVPIKIEPGAHAFKVTANAIRLEQVILNLLINALDAVAECDAPEIRVGAHRSGPMVKIEVADNGAGIPENLKERIAEPFFTTKETGEGLGLGLSISRAIIAEFGGNLSFAPREGGGSIFTVSLPATASHRMKNELAA
jgi:two-component system C4-dicarboxylate transport sensor histidine kinase DctB